MLVVDGEPASRPPSLTSIDYKRYGNLTNSEPTLGGDGYYVLGDDSRDSDDRRYNGPEPR